MNTLKFLPTKKGVKISLDTSFETKKRGKYFFAHLPHLKATGYSKVSEEEAFKDLEDTLKLFFEVNIKDDTLERSLLNFGWTPKLITKNKQLERNFNYDGDVPVGLLQKRFNVPLHA